MDSLEDITTNNQTFCRISSESGCVLESCFDVFDMLLVTIVSLIFLFHRSITSKVSDLAKSCVKSKASPEVLRLSSEVKRLKNELALLSPTSEFSAYFKTERILNKTVEQYDAAVAEDKAKQSSPMKIDMAVKVLAQATGLLLLHSVSGIYALCIPYVALWPITVILRFPSVWSTDVCGGPDSSLSPVSLFVFIYCILFTAKIVLSK